MEFKELVEIKRKVDRIMNSNLSWEDKYDMIFSPEISRKIELDYYDPDTSYEEDVMTWYYAFNEYFDKYAQVNDFY